MSNFLIWGSHPQAREDQAQEILQDHFVHSIETDGKILKVGEIRARMLQWHLYPQSPWKKSGLLVLEAQRLNEEVQNTLLKTLEEPPSFFTFVFTVLHPNLLLPTVVSRCLVVRVPGDYKVLDPKVITEIIEAPAGKRLAIFEETIGYDREASITFVNDLEAQLASEPNPILKQIWETKKLLQDDSTNLKMAVDCLLLSW